MEQATIPYYVHEGEMARSERTIKRLWIVILVLIVCLVGSNIGWLVYESQFADEVISIEQEGETANGNNIFNGTGEMTIYGEGEADNHH